jgi:hypothetical protein
MANFGSIAADDFRPRQWVIVTGVKRRGDFAGDEGHVLSDQILGIHAVHDARDYLKLRGTALYVECVSLPFVVVSLPNGQREPIDIRSYEFKRVSKRYAEACLTMPVEMWREKLFQDDGLPYGAINDLGDGEQVACLD